MSVIGLLFQFSSLSAQTVIDLGDLTAFSTSASQEPYPNAPLNEAFNGVADDLNDNFRAPASDITTLSWSVNPFENTQVDTTLGIINSCFFFGGIFQVFFQKKASFER